MGAPVKTWRKWVRELRERVPLDRPVKVVRRPLPEEPGGEGRPVYLCGYMTESPLGYRIVINSRHNRLVQQDALVHEWAHCKANKDQILAGETDHHGPLYWLAHGFVYRAFHGTDK